MPSVPKRKYDPSLSTRLVADKLACCFQTVFCLHPVVFALQRHRRKIDSDDEDESEEGPTQPETNQEPPQPDLARHDETASGACTAAAASASPSASHVETASAPAATIETPREAPTERPF
jgi:hypothetical protein